MLVITNPVQLYGKKVITDIALRVGEHNKDNFSYGPGMRHVLSKFWKDSEDTSSILEEHFEAQKDFDCDVIKSSMSADDVDDGNEEEDTFAQYDPAKDPVDFKEYNRRLEDIAPKYIEDYLGNVIYNICYHDSTLKRYQKKHQVQPCLIGDGDDGDDFTELADLQLEEKDEWSLGQKQNAQRNLSYVIKRLHNMSRLSKVHMLSYIAAYERAKIVIDKNHTSGGSRSLSDNVVISQGVYLCDQYGNITKKVSVENKNKRAKGMFDWIVGRECEFSAYYPDYLNFIHYCTVLDINIVDDDMTKYQASFVDNLTVTTVTPNRQYVPAVYQALKENAVNVEPSRPVVDIIQNTVESFKQLCSTNQNIRNAIYQFTDAERRVYLNYATYIYSYYMYSQTQQALSPSKYSWNNGFLHYDGNLVILPANWLGASKRTQLPDNRAIISELGYVIALSSTEDVYFLSIDNAYSNVKNISTYHDDDYKPVDWTRDLS